jgi:hypothetical protein
MIKSFKFLQSNDTVTYLDVGNVRFHIGQPDPPFGISRRHWNILPQDLRDGRQEDMLIYIQGWEASRRGRSDNPYNLVPYTRVMWNRGFTDYQVRVANPPPREVAVVSASDHDFRIWRSETFSWDSVNIITNGHFSYTDDNNIITRYRVITTINECNGLMFDDYITTRRLNDILNSGYEDTINHINELINEVRLHIRQR